MTIEDAAVQICGTTHVVLPAYNEAAGLPMLLHRLAELPHTDKLTVWVVDDGSSDATAEVAATACRGSTSGWFATRSTSGWARPCSQVCRRCW